mgnify:CR=1 FL=1
MHWKIILKTLGVMSIIFSLLIILSSGISYYYRENVFLSLLLSASIPAAIGIVLLLVPAKEQKSVSHKEAYALVSLSWVYSCLIGSFPYFITNVVPTFTDAFFESVSGFTTTGATVLTGLESLSKGVLFWRALTQWLGGMGIIVLSLAILPFLGVGGMELYKAEIPSPVADKLTPRIRDTAKLLWKVYVGISLLEFLLLLFGGLSLFDAICHTFTTMPTGGFSTQDSSIAGFKSSYVETVIIVFMVLAGMNFSLHYRLIQGNFSKVIKDFELRTYFFILGLSSTLILIGIVDQYPNIYEAIRHSIFQVVSIMTTTGYVTYDYEKWPTYAQFILLVLMFIGAMSGSTGGAIKVMRVMLLIKHALRELKKLIHPHAVIVCKIGDRPIEENIVNSVVGFYVLYLGVFAIATIVVSTTGLDLLSSIGAVASCIGNVGPAFGVVGPVSTYQELSWIAKWVLGFCMIMGRIEIYTLLVTMLPFYWKK